MVRFVLDRENISAAINEFIIKQIEQFVELHNELMRGFFGSALQANSIIREFSISDDVIKDAETALSDSRSYLEKVSYKQVSVGKRNPIDPEIINIIEDIRTELDDLKISVG